MLHLTIDIIRSSAFILMVWIWAGQTQNMILPLFVNPEEINKENLEKNELREFIRNYLGDQLDKMKREITDEFNLGANEQQQKAARRHHFGFYKYIG